ncbi:MAG: prepilin-type N-terminal cleavage/methylation domain-containing protein [Acidimicrobiales bacterium]
MTKRFIERTLEKRDEGGFTLIELLIVIIILAILAAIVVFAVGTTGANSKYAACSSDAKTYETAMEAYKAQSPGGTYPVAISTATGAVSGQTYYGVGVGTPLTSTASFGGPWMRALPGTAHYVIVSDGTGNVYVLPPGTSTTSPPNLFPSETVAQFKGSGSDTNYLNFDGFGGAGGTTAGTAVGAVCSDASVVS